MSAALPFFADCDAQLLQLVDGIRGFGNLGLNGYRWIGRPHDRYVTWILKSRIFGFDLV
jgi:hypothetical protein